MKRFSMLALAAAAGLFAAAANGAPNEVVIGDIDDLSGLYADVIGRGGIEAARMAIADFGGQVLGRKIILLSTDHQNKPDIGASKFREWADTNGLNMLLGGSNTGVSIAMSKVAAEKKVFFLTADYAFGYQLQDAASKVVEAHGGLPAARAQAVPLTRFARPRRAVAV